MSDAVLPVTSGFRITAVKAPSWGTSVSWSRSRVRYTVSKQVYPIYSIELSVEVLRETVGYEEARNLLAFFNLRRGAAESFRYADPDDYTVTDEVFGTRDGSTTQFQLMRSYGGFSEPVQNVNALDVIKSNGVALSSPADYTISSTGMVTLASAGTAGHPLAWSGTYYWRVAFDEDRLEFGKMFSGLWELKKLALIGSVMNKV